MNKETGWPAFPVDPAVNPEGLASGMTLRDYFAAKAMAATIAAYTTASYTTASYEEIALWAYQQADAMLSARGEV